MCLVAMFFRVVDDAPLVVGANREEAYDRPGEAPQLLPGAVPAIGGRDPTAGGTWLAVNAHGVLVAVTNRHKEKAPAAPRSRGLLVRDLLSCATAKEAMDAACRALDTKQYLGCNVVCGDGRDLYIVHGGDWLRVRPLPVGLHVLTNHDVNDGSDRRLGHAQWWLHQRPYGDAADCVTALQELCGQTDEDSPIVLRGKGRGTVTSSIIPLRAALADSDYLHAQGAPDRTPYVDYSQMFRDLGQPTPTANGRSR